MIIKENIFIKGKLVEGVDVEIIDLIQTLNKVQGLRTICSCSGHGKQPIRITLEIDTIENISYLLWGSTRFYDIYYTWRLILDYGDKTINYPHLIILLESKEKGDKAYNDATKLAKGLLEYISCYNVNGKIKKSGD